MPEIDISAAADDVVALLQRQQAQPAAARWEASRSAESLVVREALDRYVSARAPVEIATLRAAEAHEPTVARMLERMRVASGPPRLPAEDETRNLSEAQQYDVYASVIAVRGDPAAHEALLTQDRVILGMRQENRTTDRSGRGKFDDRIVVVWREADGQRHAREFTRANTEPSAQYDGHAKTNPRSTGFAHVITRTKTEGTDVNGDGVRDLGRLSEGTTEMRGTTHPGKEGVPEFSLRPTPGAIADGARRVERDSNGDGWFDSDDLGGVQPLNRTFKFHRGGERNTLSAGCQTFKRAEYDDFLDAVRGTPGQDRWQYVLTSVTHRNRRDQEPDRVLDSEDDPRRPGHPAHALQQQISTGLAGLGGRYRERADDYSLPLLHAAREAGMTRVDRVVASNAVGARSAGETLFLVQGVLTDPAALRVGISANEVTDVPVDTSLQLLQQQSREHTAIDSDPRAARIPDHSLEPGGR